MRMAATPFPNAWRSMLDDQAAPGVHGGCQAREDRAVGAVVTRRNLAHVTCPSKVTTTTHQPLESRALRSSVTSVRSVNSRPPTIDTAASVAAGGITP